jgi:hypothetical protein
MMRKIAMVGGLLAVMASALSAAETAPAKAEVPKDLAELMEKLEKLAGEGKIKEVIDLIIPPEVKKTISPEELKGVEDEMKKDDSFLKAIKKARTTTPKVEEDTVKFELKGEGMPEMRFKKVDGKWVLL